MAGRFPFSVVGDSEGCFTGVLVGFSAFFSSYRTTRTPGFIALVLGYLWEAVRRL